MFNLAVARMVSLSFCLFTLAACEPGDSHMAPPSESAALQAPVIYEESPESRAANDSPRSLGEIEIPAGERKRLTPTDEEALEAAQTVRTEPGGMPVLQMLKGDTPTPLPLKHTRVEAEVSGFVARIRITQTYTNPVKDVIEATYRFPLPENAAVDNMRFEIGDRIIEAEIHKREVAREIYEDAKQDGHTAALLERDAHNQFTQHVANIAPGEDINVVVQYVQQLTYNAGQYEFVFPMVVGQRLDPVPRDEELGTFDDSQIRPRILGKDTRAGDNISLDLLVMGGVSIVDYSAPTHEVDVVETDDILAVSLAQHPVLPNRDFVFRYKVDGEAPSAGVLAHKQGDQGYFTVMIQPPKLDLKKLVGDREVVFVMDVSGSMYGRPSGLCKTAIRDAVQRLAPSDTFDIITFAGGMHRLFDSPQPANTYNIAKAVQFVDNTMAGGGTYISDAIATALKPHADPGRHRYVFVLSDGQIYEGKEILERTKTYVQTLKNRSEKARVFTMGAGAHIDREIMGGIAAAGNGVATFVFGSEDPLGAVDTFFKAIDHLVMDNISIDWGGLDVDPGDVRKWAAQSKDSMTGRGLANLFASRPLLVHGRYGKGGTDTVTITGKVGGKEIRIPIEVTLPAHQERHGALATLWAQKQIEGLERVYWDNFRQYGEGMKSEEAIVKLALEHRIVTQWTSFVAVDRETVVGSGDPKLLEQNPENIPEKEEEAKEVEEFEEPEEVDQEDRSEPVEADDSLGNTRSIDWSSIDDLLPPKSVPMDLDLIVAGVGHEIDSSTAQAQPKKKPQRKKAVKNGRRGAQISSGVVLKSITAARGMGSGNGIQVYKGKVSGSGGMGYRGSRSAGGVGYGMAGAGTRLNGSGTGGGGVVAYGPLHKLGSIDNSGGSGMHGSLARKGVKKRAKLRIGSGTNAGYCKAADIARVVRRRAGAFRRCYEQRLAVKSSIRGKLGLRWVIGTSGRVQMVRAITDTLGDQATTNCVLRIIRGLRFAKPKGGTCKVQWPFVFNTIGTQDGDDDLSMAPGRRESAEVLGPLTAPIPAGADLADLGALACGEVDLEDISIVIETIEPTVRKREAVDVWKSNASNNRGDSCGWIDAQQLVRSPIRIGHINGGPGPPDDIAA